MFLGLDWRSEGGPRKVSGGELRRMAPKNYQLPTTHYPLPTNNYPLKIHECTNVLFLRLDWSKEGKPQVSFF
jgi:hypothetical protein